MTAIKIDRPAIFRDAWSRARAAAVAASEKVGQHIGAALRAAWASARIAPQPVQQQQASAAPVEAISITATEAERLEAKCSALREQKEAAFALLRECREERIAAVAGETDACPGVCWTNEERAEAAADEATDALDRCLADYWEACDYLRDEEREERRTSLKARIAQGPAMVLQPVQQQQACAAPVAYAYSSVKPTRYTDTHVLLHGADPAPILERRLDGRVIVAASGKRNRWIIVDQAAPSKALIKAAGKKARVADERLVVATDDLPEVLSVVDGFLAGGGEEKAAAKAARAKATASAKAAAMAAAKAEADRVAAAQARAEDEVRRAAAHRAHIDAERAAKPALDAACAAITSGVVSYRGGMYAAGILVVRTPYDSRIVAALRTVPGATWSEASRVWTVPARSHGALAPLVADLNTWAAEASAALAAAVRAEDEARTAKARELAGRRYIELAARAPQPGSLVKIGDRMVIVESLGRVFRAPEDDGLLDPWMEGEPVQYVYHRPATADEISGARGK